MFVKDNFYVDDRLTSLPTVNEAVDLVKNTQAMLADQIYVSIKSCRTQSQ